MIHMHTGFLVWPPPFASMRSVLIHCMSGSVYGGGSGLDAGIDSRHFSVSTLDKDCHEPGEIEDNEDHLLGVKLSGLRSEYEHLLMAQLEEQRRWVPPSSVRRCLSFLSSQNRACRPVHGSSDYSVFLPASTSSSWPGKRQGLPLLRRILRPTRNGQPLTRCGR